MEPQVAELAQKFALLKLQIEQTLLESQIDQKIPPAQPGEPNLNALSEQIASVIRDSNVSLVNLLINMQDQSSQKKIADFGMVSDQYNQILRSGDQKKLEEFKEKHGQFFREFSFPSIGMLQRIAAHQRIERFYSPQFYLLEQRRLELQSEQAFGAAAYRNALAADGKKITFLYGAAYARAYCDSTRKFIKLHNRRQGGFAPPSGYPQDIHTLAKLLEEIPAIRKKFSDNPAASNQQKLVDALKHIDKQIEAIQRPAIEQTSEIIEAHAFENGFTQPYLVEVMALRELIRMVL